MDKNQEVRTANAMAALVGFMALVLYNMGGVTSWTNGIMAIAIVASLVQLWRAIE